MAILDYLAEDLHRLRVVADVEAGTGVGRKTAARRLKRLIECGLAERPNGRKSGARITPVAWRRSAPKVPQIDAKKTHIALSPAA